MGQLEILEIGRRGISRKLFAEIIDGRRIVREADKALGEKRLFLNIGCGSAAPPMVVTF